MWKKLKRRLSNQNDSASNSTLEMPTTADTTSNVFNDFERFVVENKCHEKVF
jgi:hypothetical protein